MFIFIDCETSGLNPYDHDVTELGAIVIEKNNDKWVVNAKKAYHKRLLLQDPDKADEEALEVGHYSEAQWEKTGVSAEEGFLDFNEWLKSVSPSEKPNGCAHNAEFDKSMITANCDRFGVYPFLTEAWIDTVAMWILYKKFNDLTHLGNSNKVMCDHFKVENKKAHAALADAIASAQCMTKMLNRMSF